ncbi:MAG: glycogen-binding domain-containing protein [Kiritimatiellaeota bacterium]|nr:glycogen-binding domain-containing protein [Kiritimatiellota bacterium]
MKQSLKRKQVTFTFKNDPGKEVFIAGSFNNWDQKHDKLTETNQPGIYTITIMVARGRYEYKFVVDNVWYVDPKNPESAVNDRGWMNSVFTV